MNEFAGIPAGTLEEGTETHLGIIEDVGLTAYFIDGRWVPFQRIHGKPQPETILVQIWDALS